MTLLFKRAGVVLLALAVSLVALGAVLGVARANHPTSVPKPGWYVVGGTKADRVVSEGEGHLATWYYIKLYPNYTWRAYWLIRNTSNKPITVGCDGYKNYGLDGFKARGIYHQRQREIKAFDAKCHQLGGNYTKTLQPDETMTSWAHFELSWQKGTCTQITLPTGPNVPAHKKYTKCVDPYHMYLGSNLEHDQYRLPFVGEFPISNGPQCGPTHGSSGGYPASREAIDFATPVGTPVYAARAGTIDAAIKSNKGFGNHIILKHDNVKQPGNVEWSLYGHLSEFAKTPDGNDKTLGGVTQGELIGYSGESGNAKGAHLHFEVRQDTDADAYPDENGEDKAVPIRDIPGIKWYSGNPDKPCQGAGQDDGVAFGPPLGG